MTKDQIYSFKPPGFCWKTNPSLTSCCLLIEDHKGRCGWDSVIDECSHKDCFKVNCTAEARDEQGRWRKLCDTHIEPYTLQSAGRIPDEDLKDW